MQAQQTLFYSGLASWGTAATGAADDGQPPFPDAPLGMPDQPPQLQELQQDAAGAMSKQARLAMQDELGGMLAQAAQQHPGQQAAWGATEQGDGWEVEELARHLLLADTPQVQVAPAPVAPEAAQPLALAAGPAGATAAALQAQQPTMQALGRSSGSAGQQQQHQQWQQQASGSSGQRMAPQRFASKQCSEPLLQTAAAAAQLAAQQQGAASAPAPAARSGGLPMGRDIAALDIAELPEARDVDEEQQLLMALLPQFAAKVRCMTHHAACGAQL